MSLIVAADAHRNGIRVVLESCPELNQHNRISKALGLMGVHLPGVDGETLCRYYTYLSAKLSSPFTAYYPEPMSSREKTQFRCTVLELLDPTQHLGDEFDGIFCRTRKGNFEVNLPLIELHIPHDSPDFQLIEDYWYWFWNWR